MNLKELRNKKGLTQIEVAVKVGVSVSAYILWEKGGCSPSPENLEKLKAVLGVEG
ncbi:helix-turn-helix domain protein [Ruminiclostridium papyrosolvens DSM 2782]|uniref:Helix-turn-helix domain protein n=1 Tax=Ruminiclostridium papyrosolvens DSM 2782 TaxID=588581 RepID=F1TEC2_9FIRM|nr:helix-turn-helix transcriptional regulator [Ruminiclostridium papyrosolvens]EGD47088.1 helix-turn-helix domain protein [Ruminiclostridium papyrosolvens DSM 2782]WES36030.1 helix-turn-helix transcriptional regulator [Ruminiclostridium papyrosolvens DSM 2782]WES36128.1 helix-turn-helix transcriptional regulator [Ruminiclostridium papyrosolvens DSM 2782]